MADDDLVKKQWVSKVDTRTTVICLHAAGQIRPIDQPFETLNGAFMTPPAHVHCRALVMPWMPGFVNNMRKEANFELRLRPARQRAMADGRVPNRIPPALDPVPLAPQARKNLEPRKVAKKAGKRATAARKRAAPKALPAKRPKPIAEKDRPSEQITDADEAAQYLAARGPLEDVSDSVLRLAIVRVPERFEVHILGGGVSDSYTVKDKVSGEVWVMKKGDYAASGGHASHQREDLNEWASSWLARRWGLEAPEVRFAGDEWVLMRWVTGPGKIADRKAFGGRFGGQGISKRWVEDVGHDGRVDLDVLHQEAMRASIFDYLIDNGDRHGLNYLIMDDRGVPRISLIDHGLAFDGRARREGLGTDADRHIESDWVHYQQSLSNGLGQGGFHDLLRALEVNGPRSEHEAALAGYGWLDEIRDDILGDDLYEEMRDEVRRRIGLTDELEAFLELIREILTTRYEGALDANLDAWARGRFD